MSFHGRSLRNVVEWWLGAQCAGRIRVTRFSHSRRKLLRYVCVESVSGSGTITCRSTATPSKRCFRSATRPVRYVTRLEEYTRVEPLPWAGLFAARGRVLALCLQGGADNATQRELEHIGAVLWEARFTRPEPRLRGGDRWTHSSSL